MKYKPLFNYYNQIFCQNIRNRNKINLLVIAYAA